VKVPAGITKHNCACCLDIIVSCGRGQDAKNLPVKERECLAQFIFQNFHRGRSSRRANGSKPVAVPAISCKITPGINT
jgi:hypothetical protein